MKRAMQDLSTTTFTEHDAFQAYLASQPNRLDMTSAIARTIGFDQSEMSVDMDFFSRIYDVAFGEKGNKDLREHKGS